MAKVVVLSGAGISAESGVDTFRADNGLWNNHSIYDVCMAGCLETNHDGTIAFYDDLRTSLQDKLPNKAHIELSKLKAKYKDDIAIITQNVDDLFEKANLCEVIHLHGFLPEIYCQNCNHIQNIVYEIQKDRFEICPKCSGDMRPNIVFFHEPAPMYQVLAKELDTCEMLVVIGTSGYVINVNMLVGKSMKITILNNLESSDAIENKLFTKTLFKPATVAIDEIVEDIEQYLK